MPPGLRFLEMLINVSGMSQNVDTERISKMFTDNVFNLFSTKMPNLNSLVNQQKIESESKQEHASFFQEDQWKMRSEDWVNTNMYILIRATEQPRKNLKTVILYM